MKIEKLCNFYASQYHLCVILLEYLGSMENKEREVLTFFENDLQDEIDDLEKKYNYNINRKINFKATRTTNQIKINNNDLIIVINGSESYMKSVNDNILKELNKKKNYSVVKIINCYDFDAECNCMEKILKVSDKILYTTGERTIEYA